MQISNKHLLAFLPFILGVFVIGINACKGGDDDCPVDNMSFKTDILPILTANNCTDSGCHGPNDALDYNKYADFKTTVTGQRLLGAIKRESGFSPMPKGKDKLEDCEINKIEAWVNQGAKDN